MKKWMLTASLLMVLTACGNNEDTENNSTNEAEELEEVTVVLDWTPNTNHTGLYAAVENGYFEEAGLDVDIILPGDAGADQLIASGKADFGVSYQESITQARVQGVPLVSIAAVIQHNTSGFASPVEKNIETPKDFAGKTYGGFGSPVEEQILESLMRSENASADDVTILNIGSADFFTSVERDVDFSWIFYGWTGIEAELRGIDLNMIYPTDYSENLDYYTPVLATNEDMISSNPEMIEAFLEGASKGYEYVIENPAEAADILIEAVPDLDPELVKKSQEWLAPRYQDDADQWGAQKLEVWENYGNWMFENGLLDGELDAEKAFTNEYLPK
ncbi:ABC transporter substrate-binding protein [Cytobacillus gottheilii]|uniref:ABC transporter substrate-binding protein n=1 Tax=Cytobacillus gottheilii TaxID=859144 RepID=A0ABX8FGC2_9BACI|nr:ABC transporter substrate-binding protein [Cytobacillus gottheilii]QVY63050.1 ABC transporter substrate-binding protein [Cytobacillus gottheilii]